MPWHLPLACSFKPACRHHDACRRISKRRMSTCPARIHLCGQFHFAEFRPSLPVLPKTPFGVSSWSRQLVYERPCRNSEKWQALRYAEHTALRGKGAGRRVEMMGSPSRIWQIRRQPSQRWEGMGRQAGTLERTFSNERGHI
jgi:hypothetical protein